MMHRARKRGLISGVSLPHSILLFPRSHREITLNQTRPHSRWIPRPSTPWLVAANDTMTAFASSFRRQYRPIHWIPPRIKDTRSARARYNVANATWWAPSENGTGRRGTIQVTKSAMVSLFYSSFLFFFSFFFFFLNCPREPEISSFERTLHARAHFSGRSISANTRNALAIGERGDTRKSFETIRLRNRFYLQMKSVFSFPINPRTRGSKSFIEMPTRAARLWSEVER